MTSVLLKLTHLRVQDPSELSPTVMDTVHDGATLTAQVPKQF